MRMTIARAMMAVAVHCLGDHRRDWALAMQTEFDRAAEAGEPLSFAFGCLSAAWRELLAHEEGRFVLASHLLAVGLIVPMAALLLSSVALSFPYWKSDVAEDIQLLATGGIILPVNDGNRAGLPLLAFLTLMLGLGHPCMAWVLLNRDWKHVAVMGQGGAAVMLTIVTFTGVLFLQNAFILPQATAVAVELAAIWFLAQWHEALPPAVPREFSTKRD